MVKRGLQAKRTTLSDTEKRKIISYWNSVVIVLFFKFPILHLVYHFYVVLSYSWMVLEPLVLNFFIDEKKSVLP